MGDFFYDFYTHIRVPCLFSPNFLLPRQGQLLHLASGLVLSFQERLLLTRADSGGLRWRLQGGTVATD